MTQEKYFFTKILLFTGIFDSIVVYIAGAETIYSNIGWFIGVSVGILALLGMYHNAMDQLKEEKKIEEDEEVFGQKSFTLLLTALSMIAITIYIRSDDKYDTKVGTKIFEVFNYSTKDKNITIDDKTYTISKKTHEAIKVQKERVKVDGRVYKKSGWYLVNISGDNICYRIKKLFITSGQDMIPSMVMTLPKDYEISGDTSNIIRAKVYHYTQDGFVLFQGDKFHYTQDGFLDINNQLYYTKDTKYNLYGVVPTMCSGKR